MSGDQSRRGRPALRLHHQIPVCGSHGLQIPALAGRDPQRSVRLLANFHQAVCFWQLLHSLSSCRWWTPPASWTTPWRRGTPSRCRPSRLWLTWGRPSSTWWTCRSSAATRCSSSWSSSTTSARCSPTRCVTWRRSGGVAQESAGFADYLQACEFLFRQKLLVSSSSSSDCLLQSVCSGHGKREAPLSSEHHQPVARMQEC